MKIKKIKKIKIKKNKKIITKIKKKIRANGTKVYKKKKIIKSI